VRRQACKGRMKSFHSYFPRMRHLIAATSRPPSPYLFPRTRVVRRPKGTCRPDDACVVTGYRAIAKSRVPGRRISARELRRRLTKISIFSRKDGAIERT
jgi:hypothetical protein